MRDRCPRLHVAATQTWRRRRRAGDLSRAARLGREMSQAAGVQTFNPRPLTRGHLLPETGQQPLPRPTKTIAVGSGHSVTECPACADPAAGKPPHDCRFRGDLMIPGSGAARSGAYPLSISVNVRAPRE